MKLGLGILGLRQARVRARDRLGVLSLLKSVDFMNSEYLLYGCSSSGETMQHV